MDDRTVSTHTYPPIASIDTWGGAHLFAYYQNGKVHLDLGDDLLTRTGQSDDLLVFAKAIVDALEPAPGAEDEDVEKTTEKSISEFSVGDRVTINENFGLRSPVIGKTGTVTRIGGGFLVVEFSDYPTRSVLPSEADLATSAPAPQFSVGDRVVYIAPEFYQGYPGHQLAKRPDGTAGTVTEVFDSEAVRVAWDNAAPMSAATAFLAPIPHAYPEGIYRVEHYGSEARMFVQHEETPGRYRTTYLDSPDPDRPSVNRDMTDSTVAVYTLVSPA